MEFRLSENTVNSYKTYTEERNRYTGANGLDGGNWMVYKDWCEQEKFICSWEENSYTGQPNIPTKNGSAVLWQQFSSRIGNFLSDHIGDWIIIGMKDGKCCDKQYDGNGDGNGGGSVRITFTTGVIYDRAMNYSQNDPLLLVRPL